MTRRLYLPALLLLTSLGSGCVSTVAHSPKRTLIDDLGLETCKAKFAALLARARKPRVLKVEVKRDSFIFTLSGLHWGWYGARVGDRAWQFHFANIQRWDIYVNNKVFVYDVNGRRVMQLLFHTQQDCLLFADLVTSFKAGSAGTDPGDQPPPPKTDDPPPVVKDPDPPPVVKDPPPVVKDPPPVVKDPDPPPSGGKEVVCGDCETPIPAGKKVCPGCGATKLSPD